MIDVMNTIKERIDGVLKAREGWHDYRVMRVDIGARLDNCDRSCGSHRIEVYALIDGPSGHRLDYPCSEKRKNFWDLLDASSDTFTDEMMILIERETVMQLAQMDGGAQ